VKAGAAWAARAPGGAFAVADHGRVGRAADRPVGIDEREEGEAGGVVAEAGQPRAAAAAMRPDLVELRRRGQQDARGFGDALHVPRQQLGLVDGEVAELGLAFGPLGPGETDLQRDCR
jgi:hypothetical protein